LRWRAWKGLSTPTQGIVMLHSIETAGARTRASASDDNAQSAATAVTVRIKILAPEILRQGRSHTTGSSSQSHKKPLKHRRFATGDMTGFIATGGQNEARM
jgi:hypothetical protein